MGVYLLRAWKVAEENKYKLKCKKYAKRMQGHRQVGRPRSRRKRQFKKISENRKGPLPRSRFVGPTDYERLSPEPEIAAKVERKQFENDSSKCSCHLIENTLKRSTF
jgi:hypothetical protein